MSVTKGAAPRGATALTAPKRAFVLAVCAPLMLLPVGCASTGSGNTPVSVTTVANDISTVAAGLAGAFATVPGVPVSVATALTDLSTEAAALASASITVADCAGFYSGRAGPLRCVGCAT
jgi:hypothetical protein